jgi:hypothetical protein
MSTTEEQELHGAERIPGVVLRLAEHPVLAAPRLLRAQALARRAEAVAALAAVAGLIDLRTFLQNLTKAHRQDCLCYID